MRSFIYKSKQIKQILRCTQVKTRKEDTKIAIQGPPRIRCSLPWDLVKVVKRPRASGRLFWKLSITSRKTIFAAPPSWKQIHAKHSTDADKRFRLQRAKCLNYFQVILESF